jgi:hypothetical protein
MQISGHKNIASINNYSAISENKQREISNILSNTNPTNTLYTADPLPQSRALATGTVTNHGHADTVRLRCHDALTNRPILSRFLRY